MTTKKQAKTTNAVPNETAEKSIVAYVPFGGGQVDFGEEAAVPVPEYPLLQYATGLPASRPKLDGEGKVLFDEDGEELVDTFNYAGFFTEYGVDPDLDLTLLALGAQRLTIQHNAGPAEHWMLNKVTCFPLVRGIPNNAQSAGKYGLVYQWRTNKYNRRESVLYAQVMLRPLLPHYVKPFVFTVRSTQTADALTAFTRQYKVIRRAHEELQKINQDMALPLWSFSLTLKAASKSVTRGAGEQSKSIYPMMSMVPEQIDHVYLRRHEMPLEYTDLLKESTDKAVEWATSLSERIANEDQHGNGNDTDDTPF